MIAFVLPCKQRLLSCMAFSKTNYATDKPRERLRTLKAMQASGYIPTTCLFKYSLTVRSHMVLFVCSVT